MAPARCTLLFHLRVYLLAPQASSPIAVWGTYPGALRSNSPLKVGRFLQFRSVDRPFKVPFLGCYCMCLNEVDQFLSRGKPFRSRPTIFCVLEMPELFVQLSFSGPRIDHWPLANVEWDYAQEE